MYVCRGEGSSFWELLKEPDLKHTVNYSSAFTFSYFRLLFVSYHFISCTVPDENVKGRRNSVKWVRNAIDGTVMCVGELIL